MWRTSDTFLRTGIGSLTDNGVTHVRVGLFDVCIVVPNQLSFRHAVPRMTCAFRPFTCSFDTYDVIKRAYKLFQKAGPSIRRETLTFVTLS